jgi:hypothetical protein
MNNIWLIKPDNSIIPNEESELALTHISLLLKNPSQIYDVPKEVKEELINEVSNKSLLYVETDANLENTSTGQIYFKSGKFLTTYNFKKTKKVNNGYVITLEEYEIENIVSSYEDGVEIYISNKWSMNPDFSNTVDKIDIKTYFNKTEYNELKEEWIIKNILKSKYGIKGNFEGREREEILRDLLIEGWVRVRYISSGYSFNFGITSNELIKNERKLFDLIDKIKKFFKEVNSKETDVIKILLLDSVMFSDKDNLTKAKLYDDAYLYEQFEKKGYLGDTTEIKSIETNEEKFKFNPAHSFVKNRRFGELLNKRAKLLLEKISYNGSFYYVDDKYLLLKRKEEELINFKILTDYSFILTFNLGQNKKDLNRKEQEYLKLVFEKSVEAFINKLEYNELDYEFSEDFTKKFDHPNFKEEEVPLITYKNIKYGTKEHINDLQFGIQVDKYENDIFKFKYYCRISVNKKEFSEGMSIDDIEYYVKNFEFLNDIVNKFSSFTNEFMAIHLKMYNIINKFLKNKDIKIARPVATSIA